MIQTYQLFMFVKLTKQERLESAQIYLHNHPIAITPNIRLENIIATYELSS